MRSRLTLRVICVLFIPLCFYSTTSLAADKSPLVVVDKTRNAALVKQVPLTGTVKSSQQSRLSSQVSGQVEAVKVDIGDRVSKGDVLLLLDREIETLTLNASHAATQQARAQLDDAKRRYESAKRLRQQKSISIDEIDNRAAKVKIEEAVLQKQIAEEKRQQARIDRHRITAPFNGVISEKLTEVGEWIAPGTSVFTLVAIDHLKIDFQVPQDFYSHIDKKSRISVKLDALLGSEFKGNIDAVVPVSDPKARTFLMRVSMSKNKIKVTPGMSVHGTLQLDSGQQGVVITRDALLRYPDGRVTVWVVTKNGDTATVAEQSVKVGHGFNGQITLLEGVKADTLVVVQGNESLQEGQTVRIHASE